MRLLYLIPALPVNFANPLAKYSVDLLPELTDSSSIDLLSTDSSESNAVAPDTPMIPFQNDGLDSSESVDSALQESNPDSMILVDDNHSQKLQNSGDPVGSIAKPTTPGENDRNRLDRIRCPFFISQKLCCIGVRWHCYLDWCAVVDDCHECMNLLRYFFYIRHRFVDRYIKGPAM